MSKTALAANTHQFVEPSTLEEAQERFTQTHTDLTRINAQLKDTRRQDTQTMSEY